MLSGVPAGAGRLRRAVPAPADPAARARRPRRSPTCTRGFCGARSTRTTWRSSAIACWCRRSTQALPDPAKPHDQDGGRGDRGPGRSARARARADRPTDAAATAAWKKVDRRCSSTAPTISGARYNARRAASARERANPPPMIRKVNFCGAAALPDPNAGTKPVTQATARRRAAHAARHERLPVDGAVRGLARLGLRLLRRAAVQLRGAQLRADAAGPARSARPRRARRRSTGAAS